MTACPNCAKAMVSLSLTTTIGMPVEAGDCADCRLLWFDAGSDSRLAPASVLQVFQAIGTSATGSGVPLRAEFDCPRCRGPLVFVHDLQRTTRFTHWRCTSDHGELVAFTQFLREKNFIRAPSADELEKLRRDIREITCSQCGAPIDLQKDSACPFCHAPIALIDSEGIAAAVRDLRASKPVVTPTASPASLTASASSLADVQLGAILDADRIRHHVGPHDLLAIGVASIGGLLRDLT
jgi:hypothetical protein